MTSRRHRPGLRGAARERFESYLHRHPYRVLWLAEHLSAHTVAARADAARSDGDLLTVTIPPGPHDLRARRIKMYREHGRDLIVEALSRGWWQFEAPTLDQFVAAVRASGKCVIDVGANTGLYSLLAAEVGARHVYAFEPLPTVAERLLRNINVNAAGRRISYFGVAVADFCGQAPLYVPAPAFGDPIESSASLSSTFKQAVESTVEVPVITLDAFWESVGRPAVGVVKVDVESREAAVLDGADDLVAAQRPVIFYELLPEGDAERIAAFARRHDLVDGYASEVEVVLGDEIRHIPHAWNHLLVPREKLPEAAASAAALGLKCTRLGRAADPGSG